MLNRAFNVQQGVTLIELLVAVAIMGVLAAIGVPSFNQWIQNSQIKNAASSIQDGLQTARTEAVRRNKLVQFSISSGSSWTVGCATPDATCPGDIESRNSNEGSTNAVVTASQSTIVFNGLGRVTPTLASAATVDVSNPTGGSCLADSGSMKCLRVEVAAGGQIRMCDPSLSSSDPKGC